jgi:hypothetical protein
MEYRPAEKSQGTHEACNDNLKQKASAGGINITKEGQGRHPEILLRGQIEVKLKMQPAALHQRGNPGFQLFAGEAFPHPVSIPGWMGQ